MAADFEWFSTLGFPDNQDLPFIRYTVEWTRTGEQEPQPKWNHGWLLEDAKTSYRTRSTSFLPQEWIVGTGETKNRFEPVDFLRYAPLEVLPPTEPIWEQQRGGRGTRYPRRTHLFILGWMCAKRGSDELAARLYEQAVREPIQSNDPRDVVDEVPPPLRPKLERDLGTFEIFRLMREFGDPSVRRAGLLARAEAFQRLYPHCDHVKLAASLAETLRSMIAEDAAHPVLNGEQLANASEAEQVKEWIFRLRDENAIQVNQPGRVEIFNRSGSSQKSLSSPAHQLVKLGEAAIPALIENLTNPRLTRSVACRDFDKFSHFVLTVGDVALATLEQIASREFYKSPTSEGTLSSDGKAKEVRAEVEKWWTARQTTGPAAEFMTAAARGDANAVLAGKRLLKDFPGEALQPILAGAEAAQNEQVRSDFMVLLSQLKGEQVNAALLKEVKEGPFLGARAQAAAILDRSGHREAMPILAEYWKTSAPARSGTPTFSREKLIAALILSDAPDGIRALAEGLQKRSPRCREYILDAIQSDSRRMQEYKLGNLAIKPTPENRLSAEKLTAIEDLLVAEMEDNGGSISRYVSSGDTVTRENPRFCDLAAAELAKRWPQKYRFNLRSPFVAREQQRISLLNTYRTARGQVLIPLPEPRPIVAPGERDKVAAIYFTRGELKVPDEVLIVLKNAKGRKVDTDFFKELRTAFVTPYNGQLPPDDHGFELRAYREEDQTGTSLVISPSQRFPIPDGRARQWNLSATILTPKQHPVSAIEHGIFDRDAERDRQADGDKIASLLTKASLHPASEPLDILINFTSEQRGEDMEY